MAKIIIIGAGLSGISLSVKLKLAGHEVVVIEKNSWPGGIFASTQKKQYLFNSGLEFYYPHRWLLNFFKDAGENVDEYLEFEKVENKYKTYIDKIDSNQAYSIINLDNNYQYFNEIVSYLENRGMKNSLNKKSGTFTKLDELINNITKISPEFREKFEDNFNLVELEKFLLRNGIRGTFEDYIKRYFDNPYIIQFLSIFSLFFGCKPCDLPAFYIFFLVEYLTTESYVPKGGYSDLAQKMYFMASHKGVNFWLEQEIDNLIIEDSKLTGIKIKPTASQLFQSSLNVENGFEVPYQDNIINCDYLMHTGDYENFEKNLLIENKYRNYTDKFWESQKYNSSYSTFLLGLSDEVPSFESHCFIPGDLNTNNTRIKNDPNIDPTKPVNNTPIYFISSPASQNSNPTLKVLCFQDYKISTTKEEQDKLLLNCIQRISANTQVNLAQYITSYIKFDEDDMREQLLLSHNSPYGIRYDLNRPTDSLYNQNKRIVNIMYSTNSNFPLGNGLISIIRSKSLISEIINKI